MIEAVITLVAAQVAGFLALLLLASGVDKWLRRARAVGAVRSLTGVSDTTAGRLTSVACGSEVAAGLLVAVSATRYWGAVVAICMWSIYLALIARAIFQGRTDQDCGCGFAARHRPLGTFQVSRNIALICAALVCLPVQGSAADSFTPQALIAAFGLFCLYSALDLAMSLDPRRSVEST